MVKGIAYRVASRQHQFDMCVLDSLRAESCELYFIIFCAPFCEDKQAIVGLRFDRWCKSAITAQQIYVKISK